MGFEAAFEMYKKLNLDHTFPKFYKLPHLVWQLLSMLFDNIMTFLMGLDYSFENIFGLSGPNRVKIWLKGGLWQVSRLCF